MKTKIISLVCLLSFNKAIAGVAGAANNDPLVFYAIALLILGGLIGTPYLVKFIKNKIKEAKHEKLESAVNDAGSSVND